ncbi:MULTISPECIES: hypothetical protein [unclassified Pseudactinotalea]|uniref:hypothetical protein n=1 Tax=unclassified Pseudactinotalea TaxID=2649176 RepID=UPI003C7CF0D9
MSSTEPPQRAADDPKPRRAEDVVDRAPEEAREIAAVTLGKATEAEIDEVQGRWEKWLGWPVLIAAIASVPAVFLTLLDEPFEMIGHVGLWLATVVLVVETVVFFLLSPKKIAWVRRNWWLIGLTFAAILAVVFSIGPMQLFRVGRSVGALRVMRGKQVAKAGESLAKKGQSRRRQLLGKVLATVVVGAFVVLALAVPESEARSTLEDFVGEDGVPVAAAAAGVLTMTAMYFLVRSPRSKEEDEGHEAG